MDGFEDPEQRLLDDDQLEGEDWDAFETSPMFTGDAFDVLGPEVMPQKALYGRVITQHVPQFPSRTMSRKLYINTNTPFSAVVCGVQGSGKSHSTSVLLESCLICDPRLGSLPEPLSALVFHFDTMAGGGDHKPCEAAYLAALDQERGEDALPPKVTVLALPSNLRKMKEVYSDLPGVDVQPLRLASQDISGERLLSIMRVDENTQMPLYMESVMDLLRSLEGHFDYEQFKLQLAEQELQPRQKVMLNIRLQLLDSCLKGGDLDNHAPVHFGKGKLTIVDLSSPFMDGSSACGFFDLILGLFIEANIDGAGKVVVLDEAHKYLSELQTGSSSRLTDSLLRVIRQQRHLASRVIVSTQEPTVVPTKFIDLCSFVIAHRFQSPSWLRVLLNHVSAMEDSFEELSSKVMSLRRGESIVFAPNALGVRGRVPSYDGEDIDSGVGDSEDPGIVAPFGKGYLHVKSRLRVTRDGGRSILAVNGTGRQQHTEGAFAGGRTSITSEDKQQWSSNRNSETRFDMSAGNDGGAGTSEGLPPKVAVPPKSQALPRTNQTMYKDAELGGWDGVPDGEIVQVRYESQDTTKDVGITMAWDTPPRETDHAEERGVANKMTPDPSVPSPVNLQETSTSSAVTRIISLTGDRERFIPIVEFLKGTLDKSLSRLKARKRFGDVLNDAIELRIVDRDKAESGKRTIKLFPDAIYITDDGLSGPSFHSAHQPHAPPISHGGSLSGAPVSAASRPGQPDQSKLKPSCNTPTIYSAPNSNSADERPPRVLTLTGDQQHLRSLIEFLQARDGEASLFSLVSKQFGNDVEDAIAFGLIVDGFSNNGNRWVKLVPNTTFVFAATSSPPPSPAPAIAAALPKPPQPATGTTPTLTSAAAPPGEALPPTKYLTGNDARFAPAVRYLLEQRRSGFTEITIAKLDQRIPGARDLLNDAIARGILQRVEGGKPKVMLLPATTFVF